MLNRTFSLHTFRHLLKISLLISGLLSVSSKNVVQYLTLASDLLSL